MAWTRPSLQNIIDRVTADMVTKLNGNRPLLRNAFLYVLANVFSAAVHLCYGILEWLTYQIFPDLADTEMLNRQAYIWGTNRKAPTAAMGYVLFIGTLSTPLLSGTQIRRDDGILYETTEDAAQDVQTKVRCLQNGVIGNTTPTTLSFVIPRSDVTEISVLGVGFTGGADEENDVALSRRIIQRIQNKAFGGSIPDYTNWALSVAGVEDAWVFPAYLGAGTVAVIIRTNTADFVPDQTLLDAVRTKIDGLKPVAANEIEPAKSGYVMPIASHTISYDISITPNTTTNQDLINSNIQEVLLAESAPGQKILLSHIQNAVLAAGVDDYVIDWLRVDGGTQELPQDRIPPGTYGYFRMGTNTFTEKV